MKRRLTWHVQHLPSPAMVVALIALFVALGGVGYAAFVLPPGSVTSREVKDRSLLERDFRVGQLPQGPRGPAGPPANAPATGSITWEKLAPPEDWHRIPDSSFLNGWHNTGGDWAPAAYYMDPFETLHLRGSVSGGTVAASDAGDIAVVPGPPSGGDVAFTAASETVGGVFVPAEITVRLPRGPAPLVMCPALTRSSLYPPCVAARVRAQAGANGRLSLDGIAWRSGSLRLDQITLAPSVTSVQLTPSRHVALRIVTADKSIRWVKVRIDVYRGERRLSRVTRTVRTNRRVIVPNLVVPRGVHLRVYVLR